MNECEECYSTFNRATPLLNPRECLEKHTQYICSHCGRCICIEKEPRRGLQRWQFPFKSLEIAKLYLRTADVTTKHSCGIYELVNKKRRKSYKIFETEEHLKAYLNKNKEKSCEKMAPVYQKQAYRVFDKQQVRKLVSQEIQAYLKEKAESEEQKNDKRKK